MPKQTKEMKTPRKKQVKPSPKEGKSRSSPMKSTPARYVGARRVDDRVRKRSGLRSPGFKEEKKFLGGGGRVGISSMPMNAVTRPGRNFRDSDSTFVQTVVTGATVTAGTVIWARRNLASIPGTMLQIKALQYNRWRAHRLRYRFVPVTGTTFAGMLIGATDSDPTSSYVDVETNIQRLSALPRATFQQEWKGLAWDHPGFRGSEGDLWVNDLNPSSVDFTDRFSSAGNSMLAIVSTGDITANTEIGAIFLDWDIEFFDAHLNPVALSVPSLLSFSASAFNEKILAATGDVGVGILDLIMQGLAGVTNPLAIAEFIPTVLDMFRDWVPFYDDGVPVTRPQLVQGRLGAAPTEQPGFRPGYYNVELTIATSAFQSDFSWDPNGGPTGATTNVGPIQVIPGGSGSYVMYGGGVQIPSGGGGSGLDNGYLRYVSSGLNTSTQDAGYVQSPVTGNVYNQAYIFNFEFYVGQSRGWMDTFLQKNATEATAVEEVWVIVTNKSALSYAVLPIGSGMAKSGLKPRHRPDELTAPPPGPKFPSRRPAGTAAAPGGPVSRAAESKSLDHPLKIEPVSPSDGFVEFITPPRPPSGPSREMSALSARASSGPSLATIRR